MFEGFEVYVISLEREYITRSIFVDSLGIIIMSNYTENQSENKLVLR